MKLRYYLRGLGIGILVTAVIMAISSGQDKKMTDDEIKARAKELGMVESTVLSDITDLTDAEEEAGQAVSETETPPEETEPETNAEETIPGETEPEGGGEEAVPEGTEPEGGGEEAVPEETAPLTKPEEDAPEALASITIVSGESSVSVSKTLAEAGLVENASEYDRYLCANGYDKSIVTGTYEIPVGSSEEEIAKIITGK